MKYYFFVTLLLINFSSCEDRFARKNGKKNAVKNSNEHKIKRSYAEIQSIQEQELKLSKKLNKVGKKLSSYRYGHRKINKNIYMMLGLNKTHSFVDRKIASENLEVIHDYFQLKLKKMNKSKLHIKYTIKRMKSFFKDKNKVIKLKKKILKKFKSHDFTPTEFEFVYSEMVSLLKIVNYHFKKKKNDFDLIVHLKVDDGTVSNHRHPVEFKELDHTYLLLMTHYSTGPTEYRDQEDRNKIKQFPLQGVEILLGKGKDYKGIFYRAPSLADYSRPRISLLLEVNEIIN